MSAYVEECRREWRRLGVPDLLADEMAADLEADLAEAQTEGVAADEILGESDPRRFAAAWASERGLVAEQPPRKSRKRLWIALAIVLVLGFVLGVLSLVTLATTNVHTSGAPPAVVPELVGIKARQAVAVARANRLDPQVRRVSGRPAGVVISQAPAPGTRLRRGSTVLLRVGGR